MRVITWASVLVVVLMATGPASAQIVIQPGSTLPAGGRAWWYAAPGYYGTMYGTASYGVPRTFTTFPSWGSAYGVGYGPYGFAPNGWGMGLWRPGVSVPGYTYGPAMYSTTLGLGYPIPEGGPPIGAYAPALGPAPPGSDR
jgi:hypothetical protein